MIENSSNRIKNISDNLPITSVTTKEFGSNVLIFDPSMPAEEIQKYCNYIFQEQERSHFGTDRYAILFKPGSYNIEVDLGFYTQVAGLGLTPGEVIIKGAVQSKAEWMNGNALCNFWRSCENLTVIPNGGKNLWAVSQAAPFRRMHIKGALALWDRGWSSGGFIADSVVEGEVESGTQQQWYTRNARFGKWSGQGWNMVFQGVENVPDCSNWPTPPYTNIMETPLVREKPFLYLDDNDNYRVFVPEIRINSSGVTWENGSDISEVDNSISIEEFYIARPETATAEQLNTALNEGKNLLFTPGIYHIDETIKVTKADTVVLGLGLATLVAHNGVIPMSISDVDGIIVAGILFDAGGINSPKLLEVGQVGGSKDHSENPISLHDIFFRIGGAGVGKADISLEINSCNVIGDHFWIWRADHGDGVGWNTNTTNNGLVVNGSDVIIYGLFVEHYHGYQTLWNGDRGRTFFYQCEIPYDVPNQESWKSDKGNGYAAYKVSDSVDSHEAWGLGVYCFFRTNPSVKLSRAIEITEKPGVKFNRMVTIALTGDCGEITHIINNSGKAANFKENQQRVAEYPPSPFTMEY